MSSWSWGTKLTAVMHTNPDDASPLEHDAPRQKDPSCAAALNSGKELGP